MDHLAERVVEYCRELARLSEEPPATTRRFLTLPMHEVHARLREWMERVGMHVTIDGAGNLRGRYGPRGAALLIASHLDTVPNAGAFDGILGVVMAVALIESLDHREMPYPIEVIGFSDEEGSRFGVPFIGSRALAGTLDAEALETRDAEGTSMAGAIRAFGLHPSEIPAARVTHALGYLEFHIEQGPVLEKLRLPLAVVDTIAGQSRLEFVFDGHANHAGTTPMAFRHDALAAAAEWITAVERSGALATVGRLRIEPGASNVIPGRAVATLDLRDAQDVVRHAGVERVTAAAREIAARRGVAVSLTQQLDQSAVAMDARMSETLARGVEACGYTPHRMPSGAGHDAMILAPHMPAAMLFLRSPGGISHHPDENVLVEDVAAALAVGRRFLEEFPKCIN